MQRKENVEDKVRPFILSIVQKLFGEIGIVSFPIFIAPTKFLCLPFVHDVRLSRVLLLIPMQVEIPREAAPTFPREMSCLPDVSPYDSSSSQNHCTLFSVVLSEVSPSSFCRFYPSFFPSLSQVVHSFLGLLPPALPPPVHTTPFLTVLPSSQPSRFYRHRQQIFLILLFNLTEDAIFFLISTSTISSVDERTKQRRQKRQFPELYIDSIVEKRTNGQAKRERMRQSVNQLLTLARHQGTRFALTILKLIRSSSKHR